MLTRGGWAMTLLAGLSVGLLAPGAEGALHDLHGPDFPDALLAMACLVQLALAGWVVLAVVLGVAHAPALIMRAVAPRVLRQALFVGAAGSLVLAPAHSLSERVAPDRPAAHDIVGLRLPDRPVVDLRVNRPRPVSVVVRPGDTLWAIAARALPVDATDADIAMACARWHDTNRAVIGADPHLIFPRQRLTQPSGKDPT